MESLEHNGVYIFPQICTKRLIFSNCKKLIFHLVLYEFTNLRSMLCKSHFALMRSEHIGWKSEGKGELSIA